MSTVILEEKAPAPSGGAPPVVNEFSIQVATVNGSGSQTANNMLLRSIFQMGIPVSGKNLFPSNIAGAADLVHDPRRQATATSRAARRSTSSSA